MNLRQLEMFLAVVEKGGYANAGAFLHISHSAVHRQVKDLENEVAHKLLQRKGRRVKPTEAGHVLAVAARRVQQVISEAKLQVSNDKKMLHGPLRIGTGSSILHFFLLPVLESYMKQNPCVEVHLLTGAGDRVLKHVQSGELDLGLMFNPSDMPRGTRDLAYEALYCQEFVWSHGCPNVELRLRCN